MTKDDILQNPMSKMAFESAIKLLLKGNNRVSETTLFDVADILLKLSAERDKNMELQKEVYDLYTIRSVDVTPKKELVEIFMREIIAKHIPNVIAKDLTLSRRIVAMLFWGWREYKRRGKSWEDEAESFKQAFYKAYAMLKEYPCKTR